MTGYKVPHSPGVQDTTSLPSKHSPRKQHLEKQPPKAYLQTIVIMSKPLRLYYFVDHSDELWRFDESDGDEPVSGPNNTLCGKVGDDLPKPIDALPMRFHSGRMVFFVGKCNKYYEIPKDNMDVSRDYDTVVIEHVGWGRHTPILHGYPIRNRNILSEEWKAARRFGEHKDGDGLGWHRIETIPYIHEGREARDASSGMTHGKKIIHTNTEPLRVTRPEPASPSLSNLWVICSECNWSKSSIRQGERLHHGSPLSSCSFRDAKHDLATVPKFLEDLSIGFYSPREKKTFQDRQRGMTGIHRARYS
ncbi:hypothetical protein IMZ48_47580 [Candidatus Bathyarchaeota archaeon]|nr:hypothetical protein [Candidatus Bathyarchaeota archaeon]